MYEKGEGVPQDNVHAYMWFELAHLQGDKSEAIYRDLVADRMTPEQITEAQRLVHEWIAAHPQQ
jgi:TPR repeat protein